MRGFSAVLSLALCLPTTAWSGTTHSHPTNELLSPVVWSSGKLWKTAAPTPLPAPDTEAQGSFDLLYVITNSNSPLGQLPITQTSPADRNYKGGHWFTHRVQWTAAGFRAHNGTVPVITSYRELQFQADLGNLMVLPGSYPDGPPAYFVAPLAPLR